ncbi:MAG: DUF2974 domain-containing protein [Clostridiales bacterium]|nr:DUF2974 domain-containing protein [Candidatus Blautia equi]
MAYRIDEILLLENITYIPDTEPMKSVLKVCGKTVGEYMESLDLDALDEKKNYGSFYTGYDWKNTIAAIKNNPSLMAAKIVDAYVDRAYGGGGGLACVFVSEEHMEAVVAFRGTAQMEWADDMEGAAVTDTLQQINALEYFRSVVRRHLLKKYMITVTGHSKGGNKAKYITILDDTPDRCISFDGQGFSDKFMNHYRDRILLRQGIIQNHNIDYDYVNIILNDIGETTFYHGYDYGKGGFAEAHVPNTFFNFTAPGEYTMTPNPSGQSTEMQLLDQFLNSLLRSIPNDKELTEATELIGHIAQTAFAKKEDDGAFIRYIFELVADPRYGDNVAFILAFFIKYERLHPGFVKSIAGIISHFGMEALLKYIETVRGILDWKLLDPLIGMTDFVVGHIPSLVLKQLQKHLNAKLGVDLDKEQLRAVLSVVPMTNKALKEMEIVDDGHDIVITGEPDIPQEKFELPDKLDILVLAGGLSIERNISLSAGFQIVETLKNMGHRVIILDTYLGYGTLDADLKNPFERAEEVSLQQVVEADVIPDLWAVKKRRRDNDTSLLGPNVIKFARMSDLIFIALPGSGSETGKLQGLLDLYGLDYTGSPALATTLAMNKTAGKQIFVANNILTPDWAVMTKTSAVTYELPDKLHYPVVVKPNSGGASIGVRVVNDDIAFSMAVTEAFKWENEIIIEEYIAGREFSVSIIDDKIYPVLEVVGTDGVYDAKFGFDTLHKKKTKDTHCPASISGELKMRIQNMAAKAVKSLGITGYSRTDFRLDVDGNLYCLECDALPALAVGGRFARSVAAGGMDFDSMIRKIMELSLEHNA